MSKALSFIEPQLTDTISEGKGDSGNFLKVTGKESSQDETAGQGYAANGESETNPI